MSKKTGQFYEFAPFCLDAKKRLLLRDNQPVSLTSKAFETLLLLIQNGQRVMEKDELMKVLWPDSFVEEANLAQNISMLRKALGETPNDHRYILTIPGRGYQFVAEVHVGDDRLVSTPSPADEAVIVEKRTISRVIVEETGAEETAGPEGSPLGEPGWPEPVAGDEAAKLAKALEGEPSASRELMRGRVSQTIELAPARVHPSGQTRLKQFGLALAALASVVAAVVLINPGRWRQRLLGGAAAPIHSLAVLPLENLSGDPQEEYFADGMTDELITDLAQIRALKVISRTSVMRYKGTRTPLPEIARQLNVDAVLEGAVTRSGARVRVTAQLIRAQTDQHMWAESYERDLRDVLALQDDVARDIAREIRIQLTPEERVLLSASHPLNPEAHEAYLRGRFEWNKRTPESLNKSIAYYQQALAHDPSYALAYVGLADTYNVAHDYWEVAPKETMPKAEAAARKAVEMDDSLAEAHTALATALATYEWDWAGADREYRRAIDLDPNYANAHYYYGFYYLSPLGKREEGMVEIKRALELDPLSLIINTNLGLAYCWSRQFDRALEQEKKTLELDPGFPRAHFMLSIIYDMKGMYAEAIDESEKYSSWNGLTPEQARDFRRALVARGVQGYWQEWLALIVQSSQHGYVEPTAIAQVYTNLGDKDQAFIWLDKACDDKDNRVRFLQVDPGFDTLRDDPRYQRLVRRIGLPL